MAGVFRRCGGGDFGAPSSSKRSTHGSAGFLTWRVTHLDSQEHSHLRYLEHFFQDGAKRLLSLSTETECGLIGLEDRHPAMARFRAYLRRPDVCLGHAFQAHADETSRAPWLSTGGQGGHGWLCGHGQQDSSGKLWVNISETFPTGTFECSVTGIPGCRSAALVHEIHGAPTGGTRHPQESHAERGRRGGCRLDSFHDLLVAT